LTGATKRFGWQGLRAVVPCDWELVSSSGDYRRGYVCLTGDDGTAFEIRWERPKRPGDLQFLLSNYFRELSKAAEKQGRQLEKKVGAVRELPSGSESPVRQVIDFEWEDQAAFSAGWAHVCHECRRVVVAQVRSRGGRKRTRQAARQLMESLLDHPEEDKCLWTAYSLAFELDASWRLSSKSLLAGLQTLTFVGNMCELEVRRQGLANIALKDSSLRDLVVRRKFRRKRMPRNWRLEPQTINGCAGLVLEYYPRSPGARIQQGLGRLMPRGPRTSRTIAWHCESANCILEVAFGGASSHAGVLDDLVETMQPDG